MAVFNRIDQPIIQRQLNGNIAILRHEVDDGIGEMQGTERHRRVDPQQAAWRTLRTRDRGIDIGHFGENGFRPLEVGEPCGGRRYDPGGALEKLDTKLRLKCLDRFADSRS